MVELNIKTSSHPYKVHIGENIRHRIPEYLQKKYSSVLIITDTIIEKLYLDDVFKSFEDEDYPVYSHIVPSGEQSKSIKMFYELQTKAIEYGLNRQSLIIALGGGVIGDLAGFVAATFMRGIDYIQVPTTILAHDSSVGGKVAINHELGKNMIGNFYPPKSVVYDVSTLNSLSEAEIRSGYAELVKEAFISDINFVNELFSYNLNDIDNSILVEHLRKGIAVKSKIVEADERESGIRAFLNLGHTLGHAIEASLGYGKMTHGEAIAIGMIFALRLSEKYFNQKLPIESYVEWLKANNYPLSIDGLSAESLIDKMKSDKKVTSSEIPMILLESVGEPAIISYNVENLKAELTDFLRELVEL